MVSVNREDSLEKQACDNQTLLGTMEKASHMFMEMCCSPCQLKPVQPNRLFLCTCEIPGLRKKSLPSLNFGTEEKKGSNEIVLLRGLQGKINRWDINNYQ